jgi:hypothetical protein
MKRLVPGRITQTAKALAKAAWPGEHVDDGDFTSLPWSHQ